MAAENGSCTDVREELHPGDPDMTTPKLKDSSSTALLALAVLCLNARA
jgi:hypothetical protein